jgi:hypothetical protein
VSYIVESGASRSRRSRRRRAFITLLVVALMLFFAFWYAYSYYRSSGEAVAAPAPTCTTAAPAKAPATAPKPADITVNVFNATIRDGLAGKTASDLRARGFKVATVANDPLQRRVAGPATVRYGKSGAAKAKVVLGLVKGAKPVRDARPDASVDLVLGEQFTALTAAATQEPAQAAGATVPACR